MEEELKQIGQNILVPINKEAGCIDVYFLEPSIEDNNPFFWGCKCLERQRHTEFNEEE